MNEQSMNQTIFSLLKKVAPDTEPQNLQPDDNIRTTLELDSFDYLQFLVAIDEAFGIDTPEEDYGKVENLRSLVDYLQSKMKAVSANK
jgi:acyl carrier protein